MSPRLGRWAHLTVTILCPQCPTAPEANSRCSCNVAHTVSHGLRPSRLHLVPHARLCTKCPSPELSRAMMAHLSMASIIRRTPQHLSRLRTRLTRPLVEKSKTPIASQRTLTCRRPIFVYAFILHDCSFSIHQPHHSWSTMLIISIVTAHLLKTIVASTISFCRSLRLQFSQIGV